MKVIFFENGNTAVLDKNGKQMAELQQNWFLAFVRFLNNAGFDVEGIDFRLPGNKIAKVFKTSSENTNEFNYELKDER